MRINRIAVNCNISILYFICCALIHPYHWHICICEVEVHQLPVRDPEQLGEVLPMFHIHPFLLLFTLFFFFFFCFIATESFVVHCFIKSMLY